MPKNVVDLYFLYNKYFYKASRIRCEGNGLDDCFDLMESVPSPRNWQPCILPSVPESKKIVKIKNDIEKIASQRDSLKRSIENTLNSLRTYNRIKKEFPEAYELLPEKESSINTLAVPIEDIRNQLGLLK